MDRNLGFFTCYGIEYVFDYLGENRINKRIQELEEKPTASMGISLKDFTYSDAECSYFSGSGVLSIFNSLIQWFDDIDFIKFLYENSKKYNEQNYHNGGLLNEKWSKHIEMLKNRLVDKEKAIQIEENNLNPYWIEYHFFYMQISKIIKKSFNDLKELGLDVTGSYELKKNKLVGKIELEVNTRRKPLTGEYLMYREGFLWYNLELKENQDNFSIYNFTKNNILYSLILEKDKRIGRIDILKTNPQAEKTLSNLQDIKVNEFWNEVTANYIKNFKIISLRIKQDNLLCPNTLLSNGIMWDMHDFYQEENDHKSAMAIAKLNNAYSDVWREIS